MKSAEATTPGHRRTKRVAKFGICLAVAGLVGTGGPSGAQVADTLPPVTLSSTTFHLGDTVTFSGTGCVDPDTGSGAGATAALVRPSAPNGRGAVVVIVARADVAADGSFSGSGTVGQPFDLDGPQVATVVCNVANGPTLYRSVPVEVVAPTLPDLAVVAGTTFSYVLPCTTGGGSGLFQFAIASPGSGPPNFAATNNVGPGTNEVGDIVEVPVPADLVPGTYLAQAVCYGPGTGLQAAFRVNLTVDPVGTVTTTTATATTTTMSTTPTTNAPIPSASSTPVGAAGTTTRAGSSTVATAATPVQGSAAFTG